MKRTIGLIVKILLVTLVVTWISLIMIEYVRYNNDEPMLIKLYEETRNYDDGHVYVTYGLGYKSISYERDSIYGKEFGHLFIKVKEKLPEKNKS